MTQVGHEKAETFYALTKKRAGGIPKGGGSAAGASSFNAPFGRILIHFLGGTRKWPPEAPSF